MKEVIKKMETKTTTNTRKIPDIEALEYLNLSLDPAPEGPSEATTNNSSTDVSKEIERIEQELKLIEEIRSLIGVRR
jgi:hypothetical protein